MPAAESIICTNKLIWSIMALERFATDFGSFGSGEHYGVGLVEMSEMFVTQDVFFDGQALCDRILCM